MNIRQITERVIYVDKKGSVASARVGDPTRPFPTLWSAKPVLQSGDKVIVKPGVYTIGNVGSGADTELNDVGTTEADVNLLQGIDELSIHFEEGAVLHALASAPGTWGFGLFSDEADPNKRLTVTGSLTYTHDRVGWCVPFWQRSSTSKYNIQMKRADGLVGTWIFYGEGDLVFSIDEIENPEKALAGSIHLSDSSKKVIRIGLVRAPEMSSPLIHIGNAFGGVATYTDANGQLDCEIGNIEVTTAANSPVIVGTLGSLRNTSHVSTGIQIRVVVGNYKDLKQTANTSGLFDFLNHIKMNASTVHLEIKNGFTGATFVYLSGGNSEWSQSKITVKATNVFLVSEFAYLIHIGTSAAGSATTFGSFSFEISDCDKLAVGSIFNFANALPSEPGIIYIKGNYKTAGAYPIVNTVGATISNHLFVQNAKLINDNSVGEIAASVAVNVFVQNVLTNATAADGDVTYIGDTVVRNTALI